MKYRVCPVPGCPVLIPPGGECPQHPPPKWDHPPGHRRSSLSGSAQQKRALRIIRRDHGICHVCHQPGADEADHLIPIGEGGIDHANNMAAIHARPCHQNKTQAEAARARRKPR